MKRSCGTQPRPAWARLWVGTRTMSLPQLEAVQSRPFSDAFVEAKTPEDYVSVVETMCGNGYRPMGLVHWCVTEGRPVIESICRLGAR